jgi:hypothetical protein
MSTSPSTRRTAISPPKFVAAQRGRKFEADAARREKAIMKAGLLNFILPNGKRIGDCTSREIYKTGLFLLDLAATRAWGEGDDHA